MKKFLFIFITLGTFIGYTVYIQRSSLNQLAVTPPAILSLQSSAAATTSSQGSSPPPDNQAQPTATANSLPPQPNPQPAPTQPAITPAKPKSTPAPARPAPSPAPTQTPPPPPPAPQGQYKNGSYTGSVADAYYGNVQVQVTISGGKMTNVSFLQYPNDRSTSRYINSQAMPDLKQEALQAQSANVDIVSGATDTSQAFQQSLAYALNQAKN